MLRILEAIQAKLGKETKASDNKQNPAVYADITKPQSNKAAQPEKKKVEIAPGQSSKQWPLGANPISQIALFLPTLDVVHAAKTSRFVFHGSEPFLARYKNKLDQLVPQVKELVPCVIVLPNPENKKKVIDAIIQNPMLLQVQIEESKNRNKQIIKNKTLFQLAFGAGDNDFCETMKPAFIKLCGNDETAALAEMEKQRKETRESKDLEEANEAKSKAHFETILKPVIAAINAEKFNRGKDAKDNNKKILNPATLAAIATFRAAFAKSQPKEIDKGLHFRYSQLQQTMAEYVKAEKRWNYDRCALFEDGVIAWILLYAPVNDAMRFSQGLFSLQENYGMPEKFKRTLELRFGENYYHVLTSASLDFAGLSGSCVDIRRGLRSSGRWHSTLALVTRQLQLLYNAKTLNFGELMQPSDHTQRFGKN